MFIKNVFNSCACFWQKIAISGLTRHRGKIRPKSTHRSPPEFSQRIFWCNKIFSGWIFYRKFLRKWVGNEKYRLLLPNILIILNKYDIFYCDFCHQYRHNRVMAIFCQKKAQRLSIKKKAQLLSSNLPVILDCWHQHEGFRVVLRLCQHFALWTRIFTI